MHKNPLIADLRSLSRLLDAALEVGAASFDAWLDSLPPADHHLAPRLREMLVGHWSDTPSAPMAAFPRFDDCAEEESGRPGDLVGPYRLEREIGRGGMSSVWLARAEKGSGDPVALKLSRTVPGVDPGQRLASECRIAALMDHPNIVRSLDTGLDVHQRPYLVMEYVQGRSLRDWCALHRVEVLGLTRLFLQLAQAVAYVHHRGVVHRDLKPSNVLVSDDGQVQLIDFGISIQGEDSDVADQAPNPTRGMTPAYASPEQLRGGATTYASDVFSMGALFCELLVGERAPVAAEAANAASLDDRCDSIAESHIARLKAAAAERQLPRSLVAILLTTLEPCPQRRYPTAQQLADAIAGFLAAGGADVMPALPRDHSTFSSAAVFGA